MKMRTALIASISTLALTAPAAAQTVAATPAAAASENNENTIVVTGTRRTDRSVTDSASPVDVIGGAELAAQPAANLLDVVRNLVPSFYVPQNTISDASTFVRSPSLRGLGADQILVMINGKRYNRSALVTVYSGADTALSYGSQGADIANIPAIAIKNLQVLRDGATAQYGSDAIGGVINYQIRDDQGIELQGLYGETSAGDGQRYTISGDGGLKFGDSGFINIAGEYFHEKGTSRGATRPIAVVFAQNNPSLATQIPNYPRPAQIWGSSPADGYKFFVNAGVDLGDFAQLYFTGNWAHSEANQSFNYRASQSVTTPLAVNNGTGTPATASPGRNGAFNPIFLTPCPAGNATCPAGGFVNDTNTFSFTSFYPAGFTPRFNGVVDELYGTVGLKGGENGGFTWDLSGTLAKNSLDLSMTQSLNGSFGPQSQRSFYFGKLTQKELNLNLDVTYPVEVGFASPITLSGGAEFRREEYVKTTGDVQSYAAGPYASQPLYTQTAPGVYTPTLGANGQQVVATQSPAASGYGGTSPAFAGSFSQKSWGVYVGAETDVTKALSLGVTGRYEHYDSFGSAWVGKFNALWKVTDFLSLRGTVGNGFHAPSPGQNNTQIVTTNFLGGTQVQTGTYPTNSSIAQFYGATSLRPEKSTNFGAGVVLKPTSRTSLTVDGYSIRVKNRIGISQNFTVTAANVAALPALAAVGVGGVVNYFTNGFNTKTEGVDIVGSWRTTLYEDNPLSLTLAYNYNKSTVTKFNPLVINAQQRYNISNIAPKHRIVGSANWQIENFTFNVRENYYGKWSNALEYNLVAPTPSAATATSAPPSQIFGAKWVTDLDVSYTFMDHYTLTVGSNNLFNTYPDRIAPSVVNPRYLITNSLADGQVYPRSGGPFGINGNFWYVRLRVKY
ncbi:MAG TPA: TonB-dependent receptor [Sphingomonas sp.]|jgi:iron complex outermembrane receptor protein|nr:TonB-dependent receptor [Sphingomonas sp.]